MRRVLWGLAGVVVVTSVALVFVRGMGISAKREPIGRRVYPPVPDMREAPTQGLTDGELFYAIEQGIPWTAMPA
jgi:hypothetical protein